MRGVAITAGVLALIVLAPVAVYLLRSGSDGTHLKARVGHCSPVQRDQHPVACAYIDAHPAIEVVGPIDETGTPFAEVIHVADSGRAVDVRLDAGRYRVFLEINALGTIATNASAASIDLSTGSRDLKTLTPADPWTYTGVPGA